MAGATRLSSPGPLSTSPFQHCGRHMLLSVPPWEKEKSRLLVENINAKGGDDHCGKVSGPDRFSNLYLSTCSTL